MTRDDIIRMAREAGMLTWLKPPEDVIERLEQFADLVAAAEREACAEVVENYALGYAEPVWALKLAAAIRGQA